MTTDDRDAEESTFEVVMNDEEQYSIWQADRALPLGWRLAGYSGTRDACLDHIQEVWTDITPLSVRQSLAGRERRT
jgi:MbtH protein